MEFKVRVIDAYFFPIVIAGAEIYGNKTVIKSSNGTYVVVAQRTFDEAWQQWDTQCGGGIFWVSSTLRYIIKLNSILNFISVPYSREIVNHLQQIINQLLLMLNSYNKVLVIIFKLSKYTTVTNLSVKRSQTNKVPLAETKPL